MFSEEFQKSFQILAEILLTVEFNFVHVVRWFSSVEIISFRINNKNIFF